MSRKQYKIVLSKEDLAHAQNCFYDVFLMAESRDTGREYCKACFNFRKDDGTLTHEDNCWGIGLAAALDTAVEIK